MKHSVEVTNLSVVKYMNRRSLSLSLSYSLLRCCLLTRTADSDGPPSQREHLLLALPRRLSPPSRSYSGFPLLLTLSFHEFIFPLKENSLNLPIAVNSLALCLLRTPNLNLSSHQHSISPQTVSFYLSLTHSHTIYL